MPRALLGSRFRVTQERGRWIDSDLAPHVTATLHPSSILRAADDASRRESMRAFVRDLEVVARAIAEL